MTQQSNLSQEIRDIWTDAYKFHATFEKMGNSVEDWKRCALVMCELDNKHNAHPLARTLLMDVYAYLEEQRRQIALEEAERRADVFDKAV